MTQLDDSAYLKTQYKTADNLNARIQLHERFSTNPYPWADWLFDHWALTAGSHILEVGCGAGYIWQQGQARIQPDWALSLCDLSPGMIRQSRQNLEHLGSQVDFTLADAQRLPWPGETFDAVIANHMLYHVPDRAQALAEIRRVLKPGGKLYAATNGDSHMGEIYSLMRQIDPDGVQRSPVPFSLDNGEAQLAPFFARVTIHFHDNNLAVTEAEPLLGYIFSAPRSSQLNQNREALVQLIEQQLAEQGVIHITKSVGLFEAEKA